MKPIAVAILRTVKKSIPNDTPRQFYEFGAFQTSEVTIAIWATNSTDRNREVTLVVSAYDQHSGWTSESRHHHVLHANRSTELMDDSCPEPVDDVSDVIAPSSTVVIQAKLVDRDSGEVLARYSDFPQPYKLFRSCSTPSPFE